DSSFSTVIITPRKGVRAADRPSHPGESGMAAERAAPTLDRPIARVSVAADPEYLPAVLVFVREATTRLGLAQADVAALERIVFEVTNNVIAHGFPAGQAGTFDVVLAPRPGQLVVAGGDQGPPFGWSRAQSAT